ncbi:4Fe-4S dicluster domain-containing protein [bacterium]|nr:MAG: 4Fe-4S dicluster domain-containing protein [bacterium]RIK61728.1 MAG: [Fe-S]-binding protein [Planctomycetota bacterium]
MTDRYDNLILTPAPDDASMPPEIAAELERVSESRRRFLQLSGLGALGAIVAGCQGPQMTVAPQPKRTPEVTPGVAYWYASTCGACSAQCGSLLKVRDGRPIKVEGNDLHPMSKGGLCARGQAFVLDLYDPERAKSPWLDGKPSDWAGLDKEVVAALQKARNVRLVSGTQSGPTTRSVMDEFCKKYDARHIVHDAMPLSAIARAHGQTHGLTLLPRYRFDLARVIVSFGADFMGSWLSPVEFARQWAEGRKLAEFTPARHVQLEAAMSLTGASADTRLRLPESERGAALVALANAVARKLGKAEPFDAASPKAVSGAELESLAGQLAREKGRSLVVAGGNHLHEQLVVNQINMLLENYGQTLDLTQASQQKLGDPEAMDKLLAELESGAVDVLILWGVNLAYDHARGADFAKAIAKARLSVALADRLDETASLCKVVATDLHALESWNDFEPHKGLFSLAQPAIRPLHGGRQAQESLLVWAGAPRIVWHGNEPEIVGKASGRALKPYREIIKEFWTENILRGESFEAAVERGCLDRRQAGAAPAGKAVAREAGARAQQQAGKGFELCLYESVALGDGRQANNAWLQELADPLSKVTWDNYAALSPAGLASLGAAQGDVLTLTAKVNGRDVSLELPAVVQPGMADNAVAVAVGYGRTKACRIAGANSASGVIGANAYPLLTHDTLVSVTLANTGRKAVLARTQEHDSQEGRPLAREVSLAEFVKDPRSVSKVDYPVGTMWAGHAYKGHRWGMVIDLNACNGCSGCIVSCQAENNVAVVGKTEVATRREMAWLRIDRYYSDDKPKDQGAVADNPGVSFQPVMCQHCENAPCETVCPVLATTHSSEGLNQQTYNRCVGTRYCANNCPYKVRRFNWFNYKYDDPSLNLVLNPDVTIRTRGIMEKCSMCVQRIREGKLAASRDGRKLEDREIRTACEQSCPTQAIVFGDLNDKSSEASKLAASGRNYVVLGELNVKPAVQYLAKVRNNGDVPPAKS